METDILGEWWVEKQRTSKDVSVGKRQQWCMSVGHT